jgi:hypothetical protein
LQYPSQTNGDNLINAKRETNKIFRNKEREYLEEEIHVLETKSKNKNIRDLYRSINERKKGYQPRIILVDDENIDLLAGSHNILNR